MIAATVPMPEWAANMCDLHVHSSPSIMPRHQDDTSAVSSHESLGFTTIVLKSHEGSTAERASLAGSSVIGGVVLNSALGGANSDAVQVAARLGGRIVWMPTVSARNHIQHQKSAALSVHRSFELREVPVTDENRLLPEWFGVLESIAEHDMVLASGHLSASETVVLFRAARALGVERLLVNHPQMRFIGWNDSVSQELQSLGAYAELSILPDLVERGEITSIQLASSYPPSLLAFGGDLGHAHFPRPESALPGWLRRLEEAVGLETARIIMSENGRALMSGSDSPSL